MMNGDGPEESTVEIDPEEEKRMNTLQERRRKYYEERKKKMVNRNKPKSIAEMLNNDDDLNNKSNGAAPSDPFAELKNTNKMLNSFLTMRVHTKVAKHAYNAKEDSSEEAIELKGELEIADYITFAELIPKAVEMFNSQLKQQGHEMEFVTDSSHGFAFGYDRNFPKFDSAQKVSDCGVTNV